MAPPPLPLAHRAPPFPRPPFPAPTPCPLARGARAHRTAEAGEGHEVLGHLVRVASGAAAREHVLPPQEESAGSTNGEITMRGGERPVDYQPCTSPGIVFSTRIYRPDADEVRELLCLIPDASCDCSRRVEVLRGGATMGRRVEKRRTCAASLALPNSSPMTLDHISVVRSAACGCWPADAAAGENLTFTRKGQIDDRLRQKL